MPAVLQTELVAAAPQPDDALEVTLVNGRRLPLAGLSVDELDRLHWEQEQAFARAILAAPKRSPERAAVTCLAYDTICTIQLARQADRGPLVMGLDRRYVRLVLRLLNSQREQGVVEPHLFEIGYGCGKLLEEVGGFGYAVSGIEVSATMRDQAVALLGERRAGSLLLGDLRSVKVSALAGRPTLMYWNDVFEHIPTDEIADYLAHLYEMLAPGGVLVTITPHWLLRPSDVTRVFEPLRTEARGFHFKEYRLAEVTRLLRAAGFRSVATPLLATRKRLLTLGGGGRLAKQLFERPLDRLPIRLAHLLCRGLAMSCTIATK